MTNRARPAGRKALCPTCLCVEMVDARWRCLWCETVTLAARSRVIGRPLPASISVRLLREAHRLHAEGATLREAAAAIHEQTGYASVKTLSQRLPKCWAGIGLPYRSRTDAQRLRFHHAPAPLAHPEVTRERAHAAIARHWTLSAAAGSLGVSRQTLKKRLRAAA